MKDQWAYANSPLLYIACSVGIILVLVQGTYMLRKALKASKEMNMDREKVKKGIVTALVSSIGPALGICGSILALIVTLGAPVTALRMSVIGGTNYETMAANFGAKAMGAELSTSMNPVVFANAFALSSTFPLFLLQPMSKAEVIAKIANDVLNFLFINPPFFKY